MGAAENRFDTEYRELTGNDKPYPWQRRLYERFVSGGSYDVLDIPTGLGKTSVIPIWLLAYLHAEPDRRPPMRLVYVVNRRTIVDQATHVAEQRQQAIADQATDVAKRLHEKLGKDKLSVSTLRGALADNGNWRLAPHRPAIIIGTVDMIGSRLLFNAYRAGRW